MSAVERLAKKAKLNIQKEKEGTLQVLVAVAVHHLRMMSLQKGENNNPFGQFRHWARSTASDDQEKQPALTVNEDPSSENPTYSQ